MILCEVGVEAGSSGGIITAGVILSALGVIGWFGYRRLVAQSDKNRDDLVTVNRDLTGRVTDLAVKHSEKLADIDKLLAVTAAQRCDERLVVQESLAVAMGLKLQSIGDSTKRLELISEKTLEKLERIDRHRRADDKESP